MTRPRFHRLSAAAFAGSLLLAPAVGVVTSAPAFASVTIVAEDDTATPYDRSTLARDVVADPVEPTAPEQQDQVRNQTAWWHTGARWPWIFLIGALLALGYLISQVLRKRRLEAEGLPDESELFREQVLDDQRRDVERLRGNLDE